jgi:predicted nucleic-acid-binding protein
MKALDTNILVRFLVKDDEEQTSVVYGRFKEAEQNKETLFVPMLVLLEMIWVLNAVYAVQRIDILSAINHLLSMPILEFESQNVIRRFLNAAHESNTDLADLLIAHSAKEAGCVSILTFDKRALKSAVFEAI